MDGYTVRFSVNGVYNQSDPFRSKEAALGYEEHLRGRGGVRPGNTVRVDVEREGHFVNAEVEERFR
jgi:hypothetical protein